MSVTRPVTSRVTSPVVSRVTDGRRRQGGVVFSPLSLFASGEVGVWYDPSDMSTLFQDDAGLTPVTSSGQVVGRMLDKSGNGYHATQANADSKPLYNVTSGLASIKFDGIDDWLETAAIDFTATDEMTVFAGVKKLTDTSGMICEIGTSFSAYGAFFLFNPYSYSGAAKRSRISDDTVAATRAAVDVSVLTAQQIFSDGLPATMRRNGALAGSSVSTDFGTGNFGKHKLYIGRRAGSSLPFNGQIYGLTIRGAATDLATIEKVETLLATKAGVTL